MNQEKAFKYYLMSAEKNHKDGINDTIRCYKEGIGVSVNTEEARKWEEKLKELN
ncbi:sel1 repeat family protein [Veillonella sp. VA141]|uniref:sel1 repeat family protein n=1 Tax=Veillonella sp. VA141 TaxID=741833 RepID=UPI000F8E5BD7|nr:sel1 repeat family protein [Veillonella sp. VA141]